MGLIAGKIILKGRKISVPLGNRTPRNRSPGLQHNLSCDTVRTPGFGHKRPNEAKYDTPYAQQGTLAAKQTTVRSVQTVSDEDHFGLRDLRFSERCQRYRLVYCLCLQGTQTTVAGNKVGKTVSDEGHFGLRDLRFSERCQRYRVVYCLCLQGTQTTVAGNKVGRQCTCDVSLRRVCATIAVVEEQKVLHILSGCL